MSDEDNNEQFIKWWNSNWPDLAPTHQALHAWKAGYEAGHKAGIEKALDTMRMIRGC